MWVEASCVWARVCQVGTLQNSLFSPAVFKMVAALAAWGPEWLRLVELFCPSSGWVTWAKNKNVLNFCCFKPLKFGAESSWSKAAYVNQYSSLGPPILESLVYFFKWELKEELQLAHEEIGPEVISHFCPHLFYSDAEQLWLHFRVSPPFVYRSGVFQNCSSVQKMKHLVN